MMILLVRILLIVLLTVSGYIIADQQSFYPYAFDGPVGAIIGLFIGFILFYSEQKIRHIRLARLVWSLIGMIFGVILARFLVLLLNAFPQFDAIMSSLQLLFSLIFGYAGLMIGYIHFDSFSFQSMLRSFRGTNRELNNKILDTSVIIDGRIADICETGFIEGTLIIPQFILKELQHIADSSDVLKRNRGRRGLDILQKIQKLADVDVEIIEKDFPKVREVDAKLVELGKAIGGKILTNDFNLNKIAELQGIPVLNVNELANALKPVVLPGEVMNVHVLKEGKETGQGVAYLDDGTMVVVDNAIDAIGRDVEVSVTSVLQTTAGRMIFSRLKEILPVK